ncbi:hypothetical protein JW721_05220 [Candidatus Micrarchaeota archaeon]|nr:hypothetical protein [Candidatus Micrarchaeota archaeon]
MQAKTANKSPRKKSVKNASRVSKQKSKSPAKKKQSPSTPKSKLKKSVARKALRSALAKRATSKAAPKAKAKPKAAISRAKAPKKSAAKVSKNSPMRRATKKLVPKKGAKKVAAKKKAAGKKSLIKKTAAKSKKSPPKKALKAKRPSLKDADGDVGEAPAKPVEKKLPPLDHGEISKLLSDRYTRHLVIDSGGEYALEIIRGFSNNSSDEDMAKKLKIKISDVRATLNKLHSLGIVEYTRHKDSETGWFSYYWYLNVARIKDWVSKKMDEEHRKLDFSNGEHYYCPGCGGASIHDFVSASDFGFKCPTCGSSLDFLSDDKVSEFFPMRSFRKPFL